MKLSLLVLAGGVAAVPTTPAAGADAPAASIKCPIVFDGRIPSTLALADFDSSGSGSPYGTDYVKGNNLKWSEILLLPAVPASRFDAAGGTFQPVEVTLSDKSIFQKQNGFRRAGLQFNGDGNNNSPGYGSGIKTLHFSVKQDAARPLNLSHEYLVGCSPRMACLQRVCCVCC